MGISNQQNRGMKNQQTKSYLQGTGFCATQPTNLRQQISETLNPVKVFAEFAQCKASLIKTSSAQMGSEASLVAEPVEVVTGHFKAAKDLVVEPKEVVTVDVRAAKDLLDSGHYRYLDVRTEEEFENGHVENALNIPYMFNTREGRVKNPKFMELVQSVCNKEDLIVVGCQSGVRSVYATTDLLDADFKHVFNMGGGYIDWVKKGFTVKKPEAEL